MRASLGLMLATLPLLAGCTKPSPVASVRAQAEEACLDRFSAITHLGTENLSTTDDPDDNVAVSGPSFRIAPNRGFVADFPPITNLNHPYTLRCTGDLDKRVLTSVTIDGTAHRPAPNETWSF